MKALKILIGLFIGLIIVLGAVFIYYNSQISSVSDNEEKIVFVVDNGSGTNTIITKLKEEDLIKSEFVTKIYIKLNKIDNIKAGTYELTKAMTTKQILDVLQKGSSYNPDEISITFQEGLHMRKIARLISNKTNNTEKDVFDQLANEDYIDSLISKYWFLTEEIKNKDIYYSLEGYLFPDTYRFRNEEVTVKEIFETMLNRTNVILTKYKDKIEKSDFTVHELLTLASVVESESIGVEGRKNVSSVFNNRLKQGMPLGSCVTTYYAIKIDMSERDLWQTEIDEKNPYNTRGNNAVSALPVGPISNPGELSITAALEPADTNYLFFVSDKNRKLYFTSTYKEHTDKISELQKLGIWYAW